MRSQLNNKKKKAKKSETLAAQSELLAFVSINGF